MNEEFLDAPEAEILAEHGDVVVSLEREPGPDDVIDQTDEHTEAQVIEVDFSPSPDLSDHMAETAFDEIPPNNVVILAPRQQPTTESASTGPRYLHSAAGTANQTEVGFSRRAA